ncbi:hypothetical protein VNO77_06331 [Canavalia gladiata]|uniref:Late embryogenesis abundant protein LEA-2 subgroup domain-containing protein n=1 Tax=Canavalia gladiata TaxID=3824 RepID=A0AAN9QSV6_CANGL
MAKALLSISKQPRRHCCLKFLVILLVCAASGYILWPSDPELLIERLLVRRVKMHPIPPIGVDLFMAVTLKVRNRAMYWMELLDVDVGIRYRGKKLGHVEKEGWHVKGWGFAHVDGEMEFNSLPPSEVAHFLEDLAKGRVPFHAVAEVAGQLGFFVFTFPVNFKAILSCEILINPKDHSIISQHCLHKD